MFDQLAPNQIKAVENGVCPKCGAEVTYVCFGTERYDCVACGFSIDEAELAAMKPDTGRRREVPAWEGALKNVEARLTKLKKRFRASGNPDQARAVMFALDEVKAARVELRKAGK